MACTWHDGRVNYQSPDEDIAWYAVDPVAANKARSGAHITANQNTGLLIITYTNASGDVCTWQKPAIGPPRELDPVRPRRRRPVAPAVHVLFTCCSPSHGREVMPKCVF